MSCNGHVISKGGQVQSSNRPALYSDFLKLPDLAAEWVRDEVKLDFFFVSYVLIHFLQYFMSVC